MILSDQKACVIFNKLVVNNIEDSSGIFIGTNQAIGWSTYSKSNQGFGGLNDSSLTNAINVVHDEDMIDASIKDVRYISLTERSNAEQQCVIDFQSVNVNSVSTGSAIDLGDNKQLGWRSSRKVNYGTGKALGSNRLRQVANLVLDNDIVDTPVQSEASIIENTRNVKKNIRITQKKKNKGQHGTHPSDNHEK